MAEENEASPDWVRVTLRMTAQQWNLLRRAADVAGMPVSAFVRPLVLLMGARKNV